MTTVALIVAIIVAVESVAALATVVMEGIPALAVLDRASSKAYGGTYDSLVEAGAPVAAGS